MSSMRTYAITDAGRRYLRLAELGIEPAWQCPNNPNHTRGYYEDKLGNLRCRECQSPPARPPKTKGGRRVNVGTTLSREHAQFCVTPGWPRGYCPLHVWQRGTCNRTCVQLRAMFGVVARETKEYFEALRKAGIE